MAGDLLLARVDGIGHHANLHLPCGRKQHLFVGDEIVVSYGNRYACAQFEAHVPETFGPCHLVAGGGMASRAVSWHSKIVRGPTHITPLGALERRDGTRINLKDFALPAVQLPQSQSIPTPLAVLGTSMDSGKTQSACFLARGLIRAGLRVGYAKITGTGAAGDVGWLEDVGADPVLDFTDVGHASTYLESNPTIERVMKTLVAHIANYRVDAVLLEVADGVLQQETSALLQSQAFAQLAGGVVLAAQDSMGATAGFQWLQNHCSSPVLALSGVISAAPLQSREARRATQLEVYDRDQLASPEIAMQLLARAQRHLSSVHSDAMIPQAV